MKNVSGAAGDFVFQFPNGSIKRPPLYFRIESTSKFQFPNGSIKRTSESLADVKEYWFQFPNGSIKSPSTRSGYQYFNAVSIP